MVDVNVSVIAGADNGYADLPGYTGFANDGSGYGIPLGDWNGTRRHAFFRFDNVAIPAGATISSAIIRLESGTDGSGTHTLNLYFEDADDPVAPTDGTDLSGRSLTDAVTWSPSAWTDNVKYDSSDIASILQDVIDRPGWATGNALIVHVDQDADNFVYRFAESYASDSNNTAELRVVYVQNIEVDDSIGIIETISAEISDRTIYNNLDSIGVSESISVQLFEAILEPDTGGDDVAIIEDIEAGVYDYFVLPSSIENPVITENVSVQLFFSWLYPYVTSDHVAITEAITVELGLDISESDTVGVSEVIECGIDIPLNWVELSNQMLTSERYYLTLTGVNDGLADIDIPIESFQTTKRTGLPTYLSAVIKAYSDNIAAISARVNGEIIIKMGYEYGGESSILQEIARAALEHINTYDGALNRSIVLDGNKTITFTNRTVEIENPIYRALVNGKLVYRFAKCNPYLNPGDTCEVGDDSFTVYYIVYMVNEFQTWMEIREA